MNSIVTSIDDKNFLPTQLEAINIFEEIGTKLHDIRIS